jgi:hypothetical protein
VITTEQVKFTTTSSGGATVEPQAGTLLAKFSITGSDCNVAANNIQITGKAFAKLTGARLAVSVTKASEEIKLEGEKAALSGTATVEAGSGGTHHATALT